MIVVAMNLSAINTPTMGGKIAVLAIFFSCSMISNESHAGVESSPISDLMETLEAEEMDRNRVSSEVNDDSQNLEESSLETVRESANKTEHPTTVETDFESLDPMHLDQVKVGARRFAIESGCEFLHMYRVATDTGFTESLNLIKFRAKALGAEYLTIIFHREGDESGIADIFRDARYVFRPDAHPPKIHTIIVAEMYDCGVAK